MERGEEQRRIRDREERNKDGEGEEIEERNKEGEGE